MEIVLLLILGGAAFFFVVGPRALHPENIAWLGAGDPVQHFLGWQFFRDAAWSFPLGLNPNYGLEVSNGIAYSDSIPLLAISLKLFSSFLPQPFQYFGLWLLACFVLQAWFGWKLAGLVSEIPVIRWLAAGLFVFSPPMLWRLHGHLSLVGHFLLLAALYLYFRPVKEKKAALWAVLIAVAALVHAYILAMVLLFWLTDILTAVAGKTRNRRGAVLEMALTGVLLLLVCWQSGYFAAGGSASKGGYGFFRMNLLSVIDASGWSYVLKDFPEGPGDYEGFNYLGLGVIVAALFALPPLLTRRVDILAILRRRFLFVLALLGLTLFALSNKIGLGTATLHVPLPAFALHYANIFRSSGRMFWPVFYTIVFAIIVIIIRGYGRKTAFSILLAALCIQVYDTSAGWSPIRKALMVAPASAWTMPLQNSFWDAAARKYKNIRMILPHNLAKNWNVFATYAATHHLGTDAVYMARIDNFALEKAQAKAAAMLDSGQYDPDSLYVLDALSVYPALRHKTDADLIARIDGFTVVAPGWKQCADCPQDIPELQRDAVLGSPVNLGERLEFTPAGKGRQYVFGNWSVTDDDGVLSAGPEVGLLLPLASNNVASVEIELNAVLLKGHLTQKVTFVIDGVLADTIDFTKVFGNVVTITIPEVVKSRLAAQRSVELVMQIADPIRLVASGYDDTRQLGIGLIAVTLH